MQVIRKIGKKYRIFLLMASFVFLLVPQVTYASTESLVNGGFEYPTLLKTSDVQWWTNYNPGAGEEAQFGWKTTAVSTPKFEFGGDWNIPGWGIKFIPEGRQFIELNANEQAAVYQDLSTTPGTVIFWSIYQGGVWYSNKPIIDNTMAVRIGTPDQLPSDTMIKSTTNYDQVWSNRKIYEIDKNNVVSNIPSAYSGKENNKKQLYTEPKRWTQYEGIYVVPAGQTQTRFAFASLSTKPNQGNLLDGVVFRVATQEEIKAFDHTPPAIGTIIGNPSSWTNEEQIISFTAVDNESGIKSVTVNGSQTGAKSVSQSGTTYQFTASQNEIFTITATDHAGNTATEEVVVTYIEPLAVKPSITTQPGDQNVNAGSNTSFTVEATGTELTYQWQEDTGAGFSNISNGDVYSGATTATLNITGATALMSGYRYQVVITGTVAPAVTSDAATLTVNTAQTYHSITTVVSPTNGGSVSGAGQVPDGGSKTLKAKANSGYQFLKWTKDGNTVETSNTLLLTNIVEDAEYTAFFKKSSSDSKEEVKAETTHKEDITPQIPSALPYRTTQGTFIGEKNAFNIKALDSSIASIKNQSALANYFTTQYFKGKTGTTMACYDMHAPWGAKKEWKDGTCNFSWNMDGIRAGDTVFVIWYNEQNPLGAQLIQATVSADDLLTFTIPYLGDVSTISIVKVK